MQIVVGMLVEHFELFATAYGMSAEQGSRAAARSMDELRFERYRVEDLSGGTAQKLNLALALVWAVALAVTVALVLRQRARHSWAAPAPGHPGGRRIWVW